MDGEAMKIKLTDEQVHRINRMIKRKVFKNVTHFTREAVDHYLYAMTDLLIAEAARKYNDYIEIHRKPKE